MALHFLTGKPGSGKTYDAVRRLALLIEDWCIYEKKNGKPFARALYTNLPLNKDGIDDYFAGRFDFLPSKYVNFIDLDVFHWWEDLPKGSLIVVDEVHEHYGSEKDKKQLTDFRNYLAKHRHEHHEIWVISQHVKNVSTELLRIAESIEDVQNVKSGTFPYLNIPMRDFYTLKAAFGYDTQVYRKSKGRIVGERVQWSGAESVFMKSSIYKLYNSFDSSTESDISSDEPLLELSRVGAILWFSKRHYKRFILMVGGLFVLVFGALYVANQAPAFSKRLVGRLISPNMGSTKSPVVVPGSPSVGLVPPPLVAPGEEQSDNENPAAVSITPEALSKLQAQIVKLEAANQAQAATIASLRADSEVIAIFPGGVCLKNGKRVLIGESYLFNGKKKLLSSVEAETGEVVFSSGRKVFLR